MKVTYFNEPVISPVGNGREWVLMSEFSVSIDSESGDPPVVFNIPVGFKTDLASVPRTPLVWLLFGSEARRAAILHDWLYVHKFPRALADDIFYAAMEGEVPTWKRKIMWAAVRLGGGAYYREPAPT